jgi:hypothetical protein
VEKADEELQRILRLLLDVLLSETIEPDYLQIFELSTVRIGDELLQKIRHRQEAPLGKRGRFRSSGNSHDGTVWIKQKT